VQTTGLAGGPDYFCPPSGQKKIREKQKSLIHSEKIYTGSFTSPAPLFRCRDNFSKEEKPGVLFFHIR
jgi:hypothetical protein